MPMPPFSGSESDDLDEELEAEMMSEGSSEELEGAENLGKRQRKRTPKYNIDNINRSLTIEMENIGGWLNITPK